MLMFALLLFGIAAGLGLYLAARHRGGHAVALGPALTHGGFAAAGLVILLLVVLRGGAAGLTLVSGGLFVAAALGGFVLFARHLQDRPLPRPLLAVHAVAAVVAFVLLLVVVAGG